MTDDDVTRGLHQVSFTGKLYSSVTQPNHIETVIAKLQTGHNKENEIWNFSRYFDNLQFWSTPYEEDVVTKIEKKSP